MEAPGLFKNAFVLRLFYCYFKFVLFRIIYDGDSLSQHPREGVSFASTPPDTRFRRWVYFIFSLLALHSFFYFCVSLFSLAAASLSRLALFSLSSILSISSRSCFRKFYDFLQHQTPQQARHSRHPHLFSIAFCAFITF